MSALSPEEKQVLDKKKARREGSRSNATKKKEESK